MSLNPGNSISTRPMPAMLSNSPRALNLGEISTDSQQVTSDFSEKFHIPHDIMVRTMEFMANDAIDLSDLPSEDLGISEDFIYRTIFDARLRKIERETPPLNAEKVTTLTSKLFNRRPKAVCLHTIPAPELEYIRFSPDASKIVSINNDDTFTIWDVSTGSRLYTLTGLVKQSEKVIGYYTRVKFSPNGNTIASVCMDHTIKIWDVSTGECLLTLAGATNDVCGGVFFSPDGNTIASGCMDRTIKIWNASTGACLSVLTGLTNDVGDILFSPDGNTIAAACKDKKTIKIWNVSTGDCLHTLLDERPGLDYHEYSDLVSLSPNGDRIIIYRKGYSDIKIWEASTGNWVDFGIPFQRKIGFCSISPDGSKIATTPDFPQKYRVKIWDLRTGGCVDLTSGKVRGGLAHVFSPSSNWIAADYMKTEIIIWDATTGECLDTLPADDPDDRVIFSPKGNKLAALNSTAIKIWGFTLPLSCNLLKRIGREEWCLANYATGAELNDSPNTLSTPPANREKGEKS